MDFSFIIINYRTLELTRAGLRSIFSHTKDLEREIILIDNASNDGSAAKLAAEFSGRVHLIENEKNLGFAGANNQGAAMAKGRYLFFLNSDTELTNDILPGLAKILEERPDIGILAPELRLPSGAWQYGACGRFPTVYSLLSRATKKNWLTSEKDELAMTDWVSGAALVIRRELFQKIGGWDDNYFLYYEDTDLCYRAKKTGAQVALTKNLSLIHYGGQSLKTNTQRRRYYYRSQNYFFFKNYGWLSATLMRIVRWPYKTWLMRR